MAGIGGGGNGSDGTDLTFSTDADGFAAAAAAATAENLLVLSMFIGCCRRRWRDVISSGRGRGKAVPIVGFELGDLLECGRWCARQWTLDATQKRSVAAGRRVE